MLIPNKLDINQTAVAVDDLVCGPQQITTAGHNSSEYHGRTTARVSVIDNVVVP